MKQSGRLIHTTVLAMLVSWLGVTLLSTAVAQVSSPPLTGQVRMPGGAPVVGAGVWVLNVRHPSEIRAGRSVEGAGVVAETRTDDSGTFSIASIDPGFDVLLVLDHQGYAELFQPGTDGPHAITLQPWAMIAGELRWGDHPHRAVKVTAREQSRGPWSHSGYQWISESISDADGRFVFERLPAGHTHVEVRSSGPEGGAAIRELWHARLDAGQRMTDWRIGGSGRPLVGQLVGADERVVWRHAVVGLNELDPRYAAVQKQLQSLWPEGSNSWSIERRRDWLASEDGKVFLARSQALYASLPTPPVPSVRHWRAGQIDGAGRLRVEDVPPGAYRLTVDLRADADEQPPRFWGHVQRDVVMPEVPGGYSDEPLDLGEIQVEPAKEES